MNKIEKIRGERDGLDVGADTPRFAAPVQAAPRTAPAALRAEG